MSVLVGIRGGAVAARDGDLGQGHVAAAAASVAVCDNEGHLYREAANCAIRDDRVVNDGVDNHLWLLSLGQRVGQ